MMDTFVVDKPFYDEEEFKEFWDNHDLDPTMQGVLGDLSQDWPLMERNLPGIILHDKLMTDAALGNRPIKTEHSYSLASDGDSLPDSDISHHHKVDDMDDEYGITMNTNTGSLTDSIEIKDEPISEPDSPNSSCPSSPQSTMINANDLHYDVEMAPTTQQHTTILKKTNILLSSPHTIIPQRIHMPKLNIKVEPGSNNSFHLPPTPPSFSSSEDSEDNATISQPSSPASRKTTTTRMIMNHHTSTRQPINTPLISSQPKGSTGTLMLTEEEKRTLIAEGYPVPTRLPLTKAEEKSLKKIRRKIKNKISAQESRRKKKEYMDQLERRVEVLVTENSDFRKKIETLESSNSNLLSQLQKLQAIVARTHPQVIKQLKQQ